MPSQKQIQANRLNSQKSTGPRTPNGKAASSMNALRSGIDAKSQIIRGEKAPNLETLKSEYYQRFHPTTPEQRMLVDTLVDCEWLLRRFRTVEAQIWEEAADAIFEPDDDYILGQAFCRNQRELERLQRRINSTHRTYRNSLEDLQRLQAEEPASEPAPAPRPAPPTPRKQKPNARNGFVPQLTLEGPVAASPAAHTPVSDPSAAPESA